MEGALDAGSLGFGESVSLVHDVNPAMVEIENRKTTRHSHNPLHSWTPGNLPSTLVLAGIKDQHGNLTRKYFHIPYLNAACHEGHPVHTGS